MLKPVTSWMRQRNTRGTTVWILRIKRVKPCIAEHIESIYLKELKESSKRIYEVPKFIFYALGYAIERVLSMSRKGINIPLPEKR